MKKIIEYIEVNKSMLHLIVKRSDELELTREFYKQLLLRMVNEFSEIQKWIEIAEMDRVFIPPPEDEEDLHGKH